MIWIISLQLTKKMNRPVINILCRTHNRPQYFKVCFDSVINQSYPNFQLIVGSDTDCPYYPLAIPLKLETRPDNLVVPAGHYYAPHNLHCNTLAKFSIPGLIIYADDDDMMSSPNTLQTIVDENQLLIWRVMITPDFIVPRAHDFGQIICPANISGIGIAFHTKHLPVNWTNISYGDFRIIAELVNRGLQPKFINQILTQCQDGAHNGI